MSKDPSPTALVRIQIAAIWRKRWVRLAAVALAIPAVVLCFAATYYYVRFARLIDARLAGARETVFPRVLARPLELRRGQFMSDRQLIDRLNELGYAQREYAEKLGEFAIGSGTIAIMPRGPELKGQTVRVMFQKPAVPDVRAAAKGKPAPKRPPPRPPDRVQRLELAQERSNAWSSTRRC